MKTQIKSISRVAALLLLIPSVAFADGGGPLLLIVNFLAFLYGSILIILVEWLLYVRLASVPKGPAFWDSLVTNLLSTVVVGFGFPFVIGLISWFGLFIPWGVGDILLALGTWVYEGIKYPKLSMSMTAFWLLVTYFLTVRYETKILRKRWEKRGFTGKMTPEKLNWICNSVTYAGLFIFFLAAWVFEKNHI
jgi:hypothetical protein